MGVGTVCNVKNVDVVIRTGLNVNVPLIQFRT